MFKEKGYFIRTNKSFSRNVAPHNIARINWIGKGKTFQQINKPNSIYRKNIVRPNYNGNNSSILQDLNYDLAKGWIKYLGPFPSNQIIGASGEHLVLSNLLRLNFIAGLAPYNTERYDLLTLNEDGEASKSIQVKTALSLKKIDDKSKLRWILNKKNEVSVENLIFCFVYISMDSDISKIYVIDSKKVSEVLKMSHQIYLKLPGINNQKHNDSNMRSLAADMFEDCTNQFNKEKIHKYLSNCEINFLKDHSSGWMDKYLNNWDILKS